jgi:protein-S-isoprenylcysteine O-methyltransferase Ste14
MSRLPALGPRGEGWLVSQLALFAAIFAAGLLFPGVTVGFAGAAIVLVGAAIVVAGGALAVLGTRSLRSAGSLTALPHPRPDGGLVESGVYARVRHPIYGGIVLGAVGWSLARTSLLAIALTAVLFVFFVLKSSREEAWLVDRHPGYAAYQRRTKRLIPGLF